MPNDCKAHILSDTPASEDAFGSHQRLADAIVSLITSGLGGKAIALTGSWGSGKSTVIHFMRDMLRANPSGKKASVFILDAWAHEGDPLRRTFIERLIDHLDAEGWVKKESWEIDLDRITRRREETDSTSTPILTVWGKVQIFLILLVPVGYALFGTISKDPYPTMSDVPLWIFGLFVVLLPVIFASGVACVIRFSNWRKGIPNDSDVVYSFFINKLQEVNTVKTIRTPDPTTIEFQDIFIRLLNSALADKNRQLIVVVDNIDRVSASDALAIWATMRTLFEFDGARAAAWRDQFWLVVPIDKSALDRLWRPDPKSEDHGLVQAFIEKTFQIEFRISPPILSEWRNYFVKQLRLALPDHSGEDELQDVYRLYRQKVAANHGIVTPRDVKLFINNIVTLHLQWGNRIPLQSQALFAIYSDKIKNPQADLTNPELLDRRTLNLVDGTEWRSHLAALHYNIDPKNAIQVLIGRDVEEFLGTGKSDGLLKYKDIAGFAEVVERVIEGNYEDWAVKEPAALALSGKCLGHASSQIPAISGKVWDWLRTGTTKITAWKNLSSDVGVGLVEIIKHVPEDRKPETTKAILAVLSKLQSGDETMPTQISAWLNALLPLIKHVHDTGGSAALENFQVQCSSISFIEALSLLADAATTDELRLLVKPANTPESIINELAQICSKGQLRENHVKAVNLLLKHPIKWPWSPLNSALATRLNAANSLDPAELYSCVRVLVLLAERSGEPASKTTLAGLCKNGHILHHAARFSSDKSRAIAMTAIALLEVIPNLALSGHVGNSPQGHTNMSNFFASPDGQPAILEEFVSLNVELNRAAHLIALGVGTPNTLPLASAALKRIAKSQSRDIVYSPDLVFAQREALRKLIGDELLNERVNALARNEPLINQVKAVAFDLKQAWFYLMLLKGNDAAYAPHLIDGLQKIPRDAWTAELEAESFVVDLLLSFDLAKWRLDLGHEFGDALLAHARKVLAGKINPGRCKANWSELIRALRSNSQHEFLANLRDALLEKSDQKFAALLELYGSALKSSDILAEKADDVVRKLYTCLVERAIESELAWLLSTIAEAPSVLNSCDIDFKTAFMERVRDQVKATAGVSPQSKETLKSLANNLGINLEIQAKFQDNPPDTKPSV